MVGKKLFSRLYRDERGVTLLEALLVVPIVLLLITGMVEFSVAAVQWNQSVKAMQIGARLAAVSSPITGDTAYENGMTSDYGSLDAGDPTPSALLSVSCGAGAAACDGARLDRLLTGGDGVCGGAPPITPLVGICDVAPWIGAENVRITYHRTGLGYVGRPYGPVSTITVDLHDVTFDFFLLDELIPGLGTIPIPAHPVSITSEDINDQK